MLCCSISVCHVWRTSRSPLEPMRVAVPPAVPSQPAAIPPASRSIVGRKVDSSKSANYLATVTQEARRGDRRLQVILQGRAPLSRQCPAVPAAATAAHVACSATAAHRWYTTSDAEVPRTTTALKPVSCALPFLSPYQVSTTATLKVGQWVRLWMRKPGNQNLRRRLLAAEPATPAARQQLQQQQEWTAAAQRRAGRRLAQDNPFALPEPSPTAASPPPSPEAEAEAARAANAFAIPLIYEDPYLQAAVEAAAEAETEYAEAAYARGPEPDEAGAQSTDPAKVEALEAAEAALLNPLGLEPIWLASARYGTAAMASEIADGDFPQVSWRRDGSAGRY